MPLPKLSKEEYQKQLSTPASEPGLKRETPTDPVCPDCGKPMKLRSGKFGEFYGCTGFPACKKTLQPGKARAGGFSPSPSRYPRQDSAPQSKELPPIVGSPEQLAIWEEIQNGQTHIMVNALAGTGKSTMCRYGMKYAKDANPRLRIAYFAFSREIVSEFRGTAPAGVDVCTLNSIGYRVCKTQLKCGDPSLDKVGNIVEALHTTEPNYHIMRAIKSNVEALVSLCQGNLLEPTTANLDKLVVQYDVSIEPENRKTVYDLVPKTLAMVLERTTVVSYDDQLWFPVVLDLPCPKYDLIFVDEAQDLNPCQHKLVLKLLAEGGRVVMVGDPNQAIFGFRGSDVDSMNNFAAMLRGNGSQDWKMVKEMPLTVTRRCPKLVVQEANRYVPALRAHESNGEGTVSTLLAAQAYKGYSADDMILCRCNAPLVSIAFRLLAEGRAAVIRGRNIGQDLANLVKRQKATSIKELIAKINDWAEKQINKLDNRKKSSENQQQAIADKRDCVLTIASGVDNIDELLAKINAMFENFDASNKPRAVILSSIHRAKGLEADRVYWYAPSITCKANQPWQAQQETNLRYVAITRAKSDLIYVTEPRKDSK